MSIIGNDILNLGSENYDPLRAIKEGMASYNAPSCVVTPLHDGGICEAGHPTNTVCGAIFTRNKFSCS